MMEMYSTKEIKAIINDHPKDELLELIEQYIHHERNRNLLKRRLIDGVGFEPLSEEFDLTPRHCKNIVSACQKIIFEKMIP